MGLKEYPLFECVSVDKQLCCSKPTEHTRVSQVPHSITTCILRDHVTSHLRPSTDFQAFIPPSRTPLTHSPPRPSHPNALPLNTSLPQPPTNLRTQTPTHPTPALIIIPSSPALPTPHTTATVLPTPSLLTSPHTPHANALIPQTSTPKAVQPTVPTATQHRTKVPSPVLKISAAHSALPAPSAVVQLKCLHTPPRPQGLTTKLSRKMPLKSQAKRRSSPVALLEWSQRSLPLERQTSDTGLAFPCHIQATLP